MSSSTTWPKTLCGGIIGWSASAIRKSGPPPTSSTVPRWSVGSAPSAGSFVASDFHGPGPGVPQPALDEGVRRTPPVFSAPRWEPRRVERVRTQQFVRQPMVPDDGLSSVEVAAVRVADAAARVGARAVVDHRVDPRRRLRRRRAVEADAHALVAHLDRDARLGGGHRRAERLLGAVDVRHRAVLVRLDGRRRRRVEQPRERRFASAHERVVGATGGDLRRRARRCPSSSSRRRPRAAGCPATGCRGASASTRAPARATRASEFQTHVVVHAACGRGSAELCAAHAAQQARALSTRRGGCATTVPPPISVCSKVLHALAFGGGFHHQRGRVVTTMRGFSKSRSPALKMPCRARTRGER